MWDSPSPVDFGVVSCAKRREYRCCAGLPTLRVCQLHVLNLPLSSRLRSRTTLCRLSLLHHRRRWVSLTYHDILYRLSGQGFLLVFLVSFWFRVFRGPSAQVVYPVKFTKHTRHDTDRKRERDVGSGLAICACCWGLKYSSLDPRGSGLLFFMFIRPHPYTCLGIEWLTQGGVVYYFSCL